MRHIKSYGEINEVALKPLIVYHRSDDLEHMERSEFDLDRSNEEFSIFGKAIYFGDSGDALDSELGKYICKFEIKLAQPVLDMNKEMTNKAALDLLKKFNKTFKTDFLEKQDNVPFSDLDGVQYGEFFLELNYTSGNPNRFFMNFIRKTLGYNSFMHYTTYGSDFITEKGDYGRVYGIYNPRDIKFVDGPF